MNRSAFAACLIDLLLWIAIASAFLLCWGIVP